VLDGIAYGADPTSWVTKIRTRRVISSLLRLVKLALHRLPSLVSAPTPRLRCLRTDCIAATISKESVLST